ncbi:MAG: response regulator [Myxococcales bacterium]
MSDRVLVVEDNIALAENVAEMLGETGVDVALARDPASALRLAEERGFEIAIVDIGLGGKESGLDLIPKLRRSSAHGEILLMTGNASLQSAIQAIRSGVYAYVTKPFEPEQFTTLVERALAQVALKREKHGLAQRLAASEALYRGVVDAAEACILGIDAEGAIRFANPFALERLAQTPTGLLGRDFLSLAAPESLSLVRKAIASATAGESVREQEVRHGGGPVRIIRWTFTPLARGHWESNVVVGAGGDGAVVLAVGIDLTDRLELERKNAEGEAMAAMGTLATSLAHEIRNPLNAAKLQLELMVRRVAKISGEHTAQLTAPVEVVRTELARLSTLLDEFLSLARPRQLVRRPCSIKELFDGVTILTAPLTQSLGIDVSAEIEGGEIAFQADPDKLKQVLINLVGNAVEAMRDLPQPHKRIELGASVADSAIVISVSDNGPGVLPEIARTAFDAFVTSKPAGTGLGLAIVQRIASQHGGRAELLARATGGTEARLIIPR